MRAFKKNNPRPSAQASFTAPPQMLWFILSYYVVRIIFMALDCTCNKPCLQLSSASGLLWHLITLQNLLLLCILLQ